MNRIQNKAVRTTKELLTKERDRLRKYRVDNPNWWTDGSSSGWAREEFGDNLDTITQLGIEKHLENCYVCGEILKLEEKFMRLEFSFCEEYGCEMNICKRCLASMKEELEKEGK